MAYNVKFLKGTASSYANLGTKDVNTFYYIDGKDLYLGTHKLTNGADLDAAVADIGQNAQDIANIKAALGDLTGTKFNDLAARVGANETAITNLQTDLGALDEAVENHGTRLTAVEKVASDNADAIADLTADFGVVAEDYASKDALKAVSDVAEANKAALVVLNGTGEGSVNKQVADAIAGVVANAPEDFDTLKEVADWIGSDTTGAAQMQVDIANLKTSVEGLGDRLDTAEDEIDTLQSEMDTVEKLAADNKAAHEKNAADIATANTAIEKNAADIVKANEAVATEKSRAELAESGLAGRIASLEEMTTGGTGSIAQQIEAAKTAAVKDAKDYTDGQVSSLETELTSAIGTAKQEAIDEAAADAAKLYATKAQGALADTALQKVDIVSGSTNGTIAVDGSDVAVKGLGSAAYTEASAYEVAGAAASAETAATNAAKAYSDSLAKNYDPAGSAANAETNAINYVDTALSWGQIQ